MIISNLKHGKNLILFQIYKQNTLYKCIRIFFESHIKHASNSGEGYVYKPQVLKKKT
jgi:hypothetical protein